jgi:NAD(P)-dependent dehydrogenase (short-subunit alcohol dehydrogenase family)
VAVVAGATRGVGRGIAEVLGECGALVYVTGRSTRSAPTLGHPEWSIDAVAETIASAGGSAVPVCCDHSRDDEVEALFARVAVEQGRLDLLVNNLVGWSDGSAGAAAGPAEFAGRELWKQPLAWFDANFSSGVRAHLANCRFAVPLMLQRPGGLVLFTSERAAAEPSRAWDTVLDLRAVATERLTGLLAHQLREHGSASLLLYPGWTRTEEIVASLEAGSYPLARTREELFEKTVSAHFSGRAAARLLADPNVMERSGRFVVVADLAREYGFTDTDGRQPDSP